MQWCIVRPLTHSISFNLADWSRAAVLVASVAFFPANATLAQDGPRIIMGTPEFGQRGATASDMRAMAAEKGRVRVIVGFDMSFAREGDLSAAASEQQRATIASRQADVVSTLAAPESVTRFQTVPFVAMTVNAQDLERLLRLPGIVSIEQDIPLPPTMSDTAPLVDAPRLWRQNAAGAGTSIAVLDTGVRPNHASFTGKIVGAACYSLNFAGASTSLCPNGQDEQVTRDRARAGIDCDTSINGCGHGTHVAGIAAGNIRGNHGMARDADIVAIQVFSEFASTADCGRGNAPCALSWTTDQIKGLERVMQWRNRYNIAAVNMSLGGGRFFGPCDDFMPAQTAIIQNLRSVGIATVISSGNNFFRDSVGTPSCISSAITAGSTTKSDTLSSFSNHAAMVNLLAPGSSILAADADGGRRALTVKSGTSMAAPHIAGAFAMLRSHKPDASVDDIERALVCGGVPVTTNNMPKPRISMIAARAFLDNPDTDNRWNFGNDRQIEQWNPVSGDWFHDARTMQVDANQNTSWYLTQAPFCADNIRVDARMRWTPSSVDSGSAGVLISSEMDQVGNFSGLMFQFTRFGDEIDVNIYEISRYSGQNDVGTFNILCRRINVLPGTNPQSNHNLRVVKRGNNLRFLMNGAEVCSGRTDASYSNGKVGLFMNAPRFSLDNLTVRRVAIQALGGDKGYMTALPGSPSGQSISGAGRAGQNTTVEGSLSTVSARQ